MKQNSFKNTAKKSTQIIKTLKHVLLLKKNWKLMILLNALKKIMVGLRKLHWNLKLSPWPSKTHKRRLFVIKWHKIFCLVIGNDLKNLFWIGFKMCISLLAKKRGYNITIWHRIPWLISDNYHIYSSNWTFELYKGMSLTNYVI